MVVAESKREKKPMETARLRYPEKVKGLDLEDLECRRELAETLGIERVSHEDLNRHHCVDWLKAHEAHFSRRKLMETADLTGIPTKAIMGPINHRPLKLLGSPGLIAEPPTPQTSNEHHQDQVGDPGTVEGGGQAAESGGNGIARCRLRRLEIGGRSQVREAMWEHPAGQNLGSF